jgi:hypothetical protein
MCGPKFCPMQTKVDADALTELEKFAFYIGPTFLLPPQDNAPIDVNRFGPPTLAIEVGASSFKDDLGAKRLLYERLGVAEYWVVNVAERQAIAFAVEIKTAVVRWRCLGCCRGWRLPGGGGAADALKRRTTRP